MRKKGNRDMVKKRRKKRQRGSRSEEGIREGQRGRVGSEQGINGVSKREGETPVRQKREWGWQGRSGVGSDRRDWVRQREGMWKGNREGKKDRESGMK